MVMFTVVLFNHDRIKLNKYFRNQFKHRAQSQVNVKLSTDMRRRMRTNIIHTKKLIMISYLQQFLKVNYFVIARQLVAGTVLPQTPDLISMD